jgi:hypothetical protein
MNTKRIILSLASLLSLAFFTHSYSVSLVHYVKAEEQFQATQDHVTFNTIKDQLAHYYLSDAYEKEMWAACYNAIDFLDLMDVPQKALVIFDVDDTAVTHYHRIDRFEFIWGQQPHLVENSEIGKATVNKPVLELYNYLVKKGYNIIFMTGRNEDMRAVTEKELHAAGYTVYEKLILFPTAHVANSCLAEWKAERRKELSESYTLIASIGDREYDFYGGFTGHIIKLPNYLY